MSVISTGTVEIHPEHAFGTGKPLYWWLLTSRRWLPPRPINVYVIEHANGLLLFDTGQDRASVTDDVYFPGGFTGVIYDRLARFHIGEQETLTAQLATLGYTPADVDTAILSHLHQDHMGGLPELGGADLLVAAGRVGGAVEAGARAPRLPAQPHPAPGTELAPDQPRANQRPGPGAVHPVAGRHGRRFAGPAPDPRAHRRARCRC